MQSMTGFGIQDNTIKHLGKVCVELKSTNHKSLEITFRLPDGFSFLEDRIKKEIEGRVKRGRVICNISITGGKAKSVFVNRELLGDYVASIKSIQGSAHFKDQISLNAFINLPGVLTLSENKGLIRRSWPGISRLVKKALDNLVASRKREGRSLSLYLKSRLSDLLFNVRQVEVHFKKASKAKINQIITDEERARFLKDADISEELERIKFHIQSFKNILSGSDPKGKELDFISQEMQREANTMGAKAFDAKVSSRIIHIKSQTEQLREQLQNVE
jgi:uncharacterized protein (TIGR00255 family)